MAGQKKSIKEIVTKQTSSVPNHRHFQSEITKRANSNSSSFQSDFARPNPYTDYANMRFLDYASLHDYQNMHDNLQFDGFSRYAHDEQDSRTHHSQHIDKNKNEA